jgi:hypothetical protein
VSHLLPKQNLSPCLSISNPECLITVATVLDPRQSLFDRITSKSSASTEDMVKSMLTKIFPVFFQEEWKTPHPCLHERHPHRIMPIVVMRAALVVWLFFVVAHNGYPTRFLKTIGTSRRIHKVHLYQVFVGASLADYS